MTSYFDSPIGWLELVATDDFLQRIHFLDTEPNSSFQENDLTRRLTDELKEYFYGQRKEFSIPVKPEGTPFQETVWEELKKIPYGQTSTYGEMAQKLGDKNKVRAVGKANGSNPIPIIIPCHRVIGADNSLVGYAGGISKKRFLLKHEGAILL
ncbi:MAG TPA: methylated-DNA--[protein]-cysteine S-methyltransferase [Balneolaceae bacterium]|nr:methylated-DNA--[protein]-cysteine S-methyltransferase [Balneolaceae bacterium]